MTNLEAGSKVHVKFAGLSFDGTVTRVGADKGSETKVQVQNEEGGKPLWYLITAVKPLSDDKSETVSFMFAGSKITGTVIEEDGDSVKVESGGKKKVIHTVKKSEIIAEKEMTEEAPKKEEPSAEIIPEEAKEEKAVETPQVKATVLGEAILDFLQKNTVKGETPDCRTTTEISDFVGKTQPQIKAALNALSDLGLVLIGVCSEDMNTTALTPEGFDYKCGEPVDLKKISKEGKTVSKKERVLHFMSQGMKPKEIAEIVGCDVSYPTISSMKAKFKEINGRDYIWK